MTSPKVTFLHVVDTRTKLGKICETVQQQFDEGKRIQIVVPSDAAAKYLDELLWRLPVESFLPHKITQEASEESVIITTEQKNLNKAAVLFNLCSTLPSHCDQFDHIYDLLDETDPTKQQQSLHRQAQYGANCPEVLKLNP